MKIPKSLVMMALPIALLVSCLTVIPPINPSPCVTGNAPSGTAVQLLDTYNGNGIKNGANSPQFSLAVPTIITWIATYHYNGGTGATPSFVGFEASLSNTPKCYFAATAENSSPQPINWIVTPNFQLEPGLYLVKDFDTSTWSSNALSGGQGFAKIRGAPTLPAGGGTIPVILKNARAGTQSCAVGGAVGGWSVDFMLSSNSKPITLAVFSGNSASRPAMKLSAIPNGTLLDTQNAASNQGTNTVNIPANVDISKPLTLTISECGALSSLDVTKLAIQVFE
jgi:hypothetical protein